MDQQLKEDLFNVDATVAHLSGTLSQYADDQSPGPKIEVRAYYEPKHTLLITPRGEKVKSDTFVIFDEADFDIDEDEHTEGLFEFIWLDRTDNTDDSEARRPKMVQRCFGEGGKLDHWEVFL